MKHYRLTIRCPILMIKRLHDANLHAAFCYDYVHLQQIVLIYEIKKITGASLEQGSALCLGEVLTMMGATLSN